MVQIRAALLGWAARLVGSMAVGSNRDRINRSGLGMTLRKITSEDLTTLRWIDMPVQDLERIAWAESDTVTRWWRIVAEIACSSCDAYQAADSDPTNDKQVATTLALALFNGVGWRVDKQHRPVCGDCAQELENR